MTCETVFTPASWYGLVPFVFLFFFPLYMFPWVFKNWLIILLHLSLNFSQACIHISQEDRFLMLRSMLLHPFLCPRDSHPHSNFWLHPSTLHLESWHLATPTTLTLLELHYPPCTPMHRWPCFLFLFSFYSLKHIDKLKFVHTIMSLFYSGSVTGVWWSDVFRHSTAAGSTQTFSTTSHFTASHSQTSPTRGESHWN